ncbi:hypothetical protein GG344DRAFT_70738 [Lentinula edodes]|nr:hypothetical protein GG344DRAFT_70738 [Lentinula edodes]
MNWGRRGAATGGGVERQTIGDEEMIFRFISFGDAVVLSHGDRKQKENRGNGGVRRRKGEEGERVENDEQRTKENKRITSAKQVAPGRRRTMEERGKSQEERGGKARRPKGETKESMTSDQRDDKGKGIEAKKERKEHKERDSNRQSFIALVLPLALAAELVDAHDRECEDSTKTTFLRREGVSKGVVLEAKEEVVNEEEVKNGIECQDRARRQRCTTTSTSNSVSFYYQSAAAMSNERSERSEREPKGSRGCVKERMSRMSREGGAEDDSRQNIMVIHYDWAWTQQRWGIEPWCYRDGTRLADAGAFTTMVAVSVQVSSFFLYTSSSSLRFWRLYTTSASASAAASAPNPRFRFYYHFLLLPLLLLPASNEKPRTEGGYGGGYGGGDGEKIQRRRVEREEGWRTENGERKAEEEGLRENKGGRTHWRLGWETRSMLKAAKYPGREGKDEA